MDPVQQIIERAMRRPRTIVLPDGTDPHTWAAARRLADEAIAVPIILGDSERGEAAAKEAGVTWSGITLVHPDSSPKRAEYAAEFTRLHAHSGITVEQARERMRDELQYGVMMVRMGDADGGVAGAAWAPGEVTRVAIQSLEPVPGAGTISSLHLIVTPDQRVFSFAGTGIAPDPDAEQLAAIAIASARTHRALTEAEPAVAMLSFSTKGSAAHARVAKVVEATSLARDRAPSLAIDGELQLDAAIVEEIGRRKAPGSVVAGHANVLVFPDLDAGNIACQLAQHLAGAQAIGPIVQGLAGPFYEVGRGCSAAEIVNLCAICSVVAVSVEDR